MLVNKLVTHANKEGFGLIFLSGDRHGNLPPLLKTKQTIPCQILLQVCRIGEMAEAPKLFLSSPSPEREAVLPQSNDDIESAKSKPKTWRSQTAFELSSSMSCESEASFIINEFLQKTVSNNESVSASDPKLESYV